MRCGVVVAGLSLLLGCSGRTVALSLPEGAVAGVLIEHGARASEARAIPVPGGEPLRLDDEPGLDLVLLAYDRPLESWAIAVSSDGTIPLVPLGTGDGWPFPPPSSWRAYRGADGEIVEHDGSTALDARTAAVGPARPACAPVTGYDTTRVLFDTEVRSTRLGALDRDLALVTTFQHPDDDGATATATLGFHLVQRRGSSRAGDLLVRGSTQARVGAVRDDDGSWVLVGEADRVRVYRIDDSGHLTLDRELAGGVDAASVQRLRDGRWIVAGARPPTVRVLHPGARQWELLVSGPHPDPSGERRCELATAHPGILVDADGTSALVSVVGWGLFRVPLDRPSTWSSPIDLAEPGPFCEVPIVRLAGDAELAFPTKLGRGTEPLDTTTAWRPDRRSAWRALPAYPPFDLFAHRGRALTVSSNGAVDTFDYELRRPELPPRRCAQRPAIATRAEAYQDRVMVVGDGGLRELGLNGALVQWLDLGGS